MTKTLRTLVSLAALLPAACTQPTVPSSSATPLASEAVIELPGVEGRIDHLALDSGRDRLFIAALGNNSLEVVDLKAGKRIKSVRGLGEPQGILYLPDLDCVVVALGTGGTCEVFDAGTLKKVASVPVGQDCDNLRYDPKQKRVYVAYGDGALGIIDTGSWKLLGQIPLAGHPEAFALDAAGRRAFVNVPGARQVAVLDLDKRAVLATWKIQEARANYPMTRVPASGGSDSGDLVLLGCRSPSRLVLRSERSGKAAGTVQLSGDADDLFYDSARQRIYAACGEGFVDVFDCKQEGIQTLARFPTAAGARTCLFVPERKQIFVAVPHHGKQGAEIRILKVVD